MLGKTIFKSVWLTISVTVAATLASSASAQDIDARTLVEQMSADIAGIDRFVVQGDAYADARLGAGQIIEHASQVTLRLQRQPAAVRISKRSAEETTEIFFDDGLISVYNDGDDFYAQTKIPEGVESMFDFAVNDVGIEAPLLDFVSSNIAGDLLQDADEVRYLGVSLIRDKTFHHIGIRSSEVDVQVWVASEGRPLPGKLSISSKWEGGSPRFVAFFSWDTDPSFAADLFSFDPPADAVAIGFLVDIQE